MIITKKYIEKYSPLPKNYNYDEVMNYVNIAEDIWVVPVIGRPLYDELQEQVKNNTVSEVNATLLLEIYPYLAYATALEALPFIAYHMTEVGITKSKSDNSESVELKELNYIINHLKAQTEYRKEMLIKWLKEYGSNYPSYYPSECDCGCSCSTSKKKSSGNVIYSPRHRNTRIR